MNWELTHNVLLSLGLLALVVGLLLRFSWGRTVLTAIAVVLILAATLSGDWYASDGNDGSPDPLKASRYLLWCGTLDIAAILLIDILKH